MIKSVLNPTANLKRAKWCHATRRIPQDRAVGLEACPKEIKPGDLLLAEVTSIRQHRRVQLRDGRYSPLFLDDLVVLAAGDRFATDQFIGHVGVRDDRTLDLLAGGGVAGLEQARHGAIKPATKLILHGQLLGGDGAVLNLMDGALTDGPTGRPKAVFTVLGSGMNAGKTDAVAGLVNGLTRFGLRVGAIKATGTAAFGDTNLYEAAGAQTVLDFTDCGMASTYRQPIERVEASITRLLAETVQAGCEVTIIEIADGLAQVETKELLSRSALKRLTDGWLLATADALTAEAALMRLTSQGIEPLALTGLITRSPVVADLSFGKIPILDRSDLADPASASALFEMLRQDIAAQ
ncbi:hypothetical protein [Phaeobacter gallaeciensis]|uniref:hypothetical protein n=1 Tax=Phaeobacter gallaeciensis TaxID=60890 RepID=UPI00237F33FD|nr:hypothetical protein [Phaeobacter gallaeciensis]MDE4063651.1 hypothetical protein [Phaeobacter gallaeciensis]MDE4126661.1 hypothetical protein [Phaeobacter gallaeciensis]MDE4131147.1 hypothetical protein [Phaeobacter gallaeciensis]